MGRQRDDRLTSTAMGCERDAAGNTIVQMRRHRDAAELPVPIVGMCWDCELTTTGFHLLPDRLNHLITGQWPCQKCQQPIKAAEQITLSHVDDNGYVVNRVKVRPPDGNPEFRSLTYVQLRELQTRITEAIEAGTAEEVDAVIADLPDPIRSRFRWADFSNSERLQALGLIVAVLALLVTAVGVSGAVHRGPTDEEIGQKIEQAQREWERSLPEATRPEPGTEVTRRPDRLPPGR